MARIPTCTSASLLHLLPTACALPPSSCLPALAEGCAVGALPLHSCQQGVDVLQAGAAPPREVLCRVRQEGQLAQGPAAEALCRTRHLQQAAAADGMERARGRGFSPDDTLMGKQTWVAAQQAGRCMHPGLAGGRLPQVRGLWLTAKEARVNGASTPALPGLQRTPEVAAMLRCRPLLLHAAPAAGLACRRQARARADPHCCCPGVVAACCPLCLFQLAGLCVWCQRAAVCHNARLLQLGDACAQDLKPTQGPAR